MSYDANNTVTNLLTCLSFPIKLYAEKACGWGSAFLLRANGRDSIVTAWHNLTGRDFITKQPITNKRDQPECLPEWADVNLPLISEVREDGHYLMQSMSFRLNLYVHGTPIWRVDATHGSRYDIAVIPIDELASSGCIADGTDRKQVEEIASKLNGEGECAKVSFADHRLRLLCAQRPEFTNQLTVSQDVFVVGFPMAFAVEQGFAVWKRGSIAYEPNLSIGNRPCLLIDTATRRGLSGSPVFGSFANPSFPLSPRGGLLTRMGTEFGFIGLYTARIGSGLEQAQLGVVWKLEALESVVRGGRIGTADFGALCLEGRGEPLVGM